MEIKLCKKEQNIILCKRIQTGDPKAEIELLKLNDKMLRYFIDKGKQKGYLTHLYTEEDAYQDCAMALIHAAKKWQIQENKTFEPYAAWELKDVIKRHSNLTIVSMTLNKYMSICDTDEINQYRDIKPIPETYKERYGSEIDCLSFAISSENKEILFNEIQKLSERNQVILILRYGLDGNLPKTYREIASIIGVGHERIRQLESLSIRKLCRSMNEQNIEDIFYIIDGRKDLETKYHNILVKSGYYQKEESKKEFEEIER